jgi:hypothetical protein
VSRLLRVAGPGCFVGLVRERAVADAVPDQPRRAQMMLDRHERAGRRAEVTEEVGGSPGAGRRPRTRHQALQDEAEALALGIRLSVSNCQLSIVRVVWSGSWVCVVVVVVVSELSEPGTQGPEPLERWRGGARGRGGGAGAWGARQSGQSAKCGRYYYIYSGAGGVCLGLGVDSGWCRRLPGRPPPPHLRFDQPALAGFPVATFFE